MLLPPLLCSNEKASLSFERFREPLEGKSSKAMRKLTVTLAFILLALAALALAPETALAPYADVAHAVLPKAIAAAAFLLLLAIIADRPKAEPARIAAEAVNLAAPVPTAN